MYVLINIGKFITGFQSQQYCSEDRTIIDFETIIFGEEMFDEKFFPLFATVGVWGLWIISFLRLPLLVHTFPAVWRLQPSHLISWVAPMIGIFIINSDAKLLRGFYFFLQAKCVYLVSSILIFIFNLNLFELMNLSY